MSSDYIMPQDKYNGNWRQEDADEYMIHFLAYIDNTAKIFTALKSGIDYKGISEIRNYIFSADWSLEIEQTLECSIGHKSTKTEPVKQININVKKEDLYASFKYYFASEILKDENAYDCKNCNQKVRAEKILKVKKIPKVLKIVLKRTRINLESGALYKNKKWVAAPELFQPNELNNGNSIYCLSSVVLHCGETADSGHYITVSRNIIDEHWYKYDDTTIARIENFIQEGLINKNNFTTGGPLKDFEPYIFLYQKECDRLRFNREYKGFGYCDFTKMINILFDFIEEYRFTKKLAIKHNIKDLRLPSSENCEGGILEFINLCLKRIDKAAEILFYQLNKESNKESHKEPHKESHTESHREAHKESHTELRKNDIRTT